MNQDDVSKKNLVFTGRVHCGFPALRKSLTTREKISYFSRVLLGFLKAKQNKGLLCLYDKQNNTWARADMEFNSTSHSFAVLTRELSS